MPGRTTVGSRLERAFRLRRCRPLRTAGNGLLHSHVTNRDDCEFWRTCRTMSVPATLRHRIALFRETARVFRSPHELFAENSCIQVMLGQGIHPEQHHHIADLMNDTELGGFLDDIRTRLERTLAQLPAHADYLARYAERPGQPGEPAKAMQTAA